MIYIWIDKFSDNDWDNLTVLRKHATMQRQNNLKKCLCEGNFVSEKNGDPLKLSITVILIVEN